MTRRELDALTRALAAFQDAHGGLAALALASDSKEVRDAAWQAIDGMARAKSEITDVVRHARPGLRGRLRMLLLGKTARLRGITPPPGRDT